MANADSTPILPLRSEFAHDPDMTELIGLFQRELPDRVASIERAFTGGEQDQLKRLAHQLKGASAGYGYPQIGLAAAAVEDGLRALAGAPKVSLTSIESKVKELVTLCRRAARG